jgi:hypothetical protein
MRHWQIVAAGIAGLAPLRASLQDTVAGQTPEELSVVYGIDRFDWRQHNPEAPVYMRSN